MSEKDFARLEVVKERLAKSMASALEKVGALVNPLSAALHDHQSEVAKLVAAGRATRDAVAVPMMIVRDFKPADAANVAKLMSHQNAKTFCVLDAANPEARAALDGPQRKVLDSLAFWESIGIASPNDSAVAFVAGYTPGSSSYKTPRGSLRTAGLIAFDAQNGRHLTKAGRTVATFPEARSSLAGLHEMILRCLDGPQQKVLKALIGVYPGAMSNDELAAAAGYTADSSSYKTPRGSLRTYGLIEFRDGGVGATKVLFPDGLN